MVRYPLSERSSVNDIANIAIRAPGSRDTIPLDKLAELIPSQSAASIYRQNQRRAITISADIDAVAHDVNVIRAEP